MDSKLNVFLDTMTKTLINTFPVIKFNARNKDFIGLKFNERQKMKFYGMVDKWEKEVVDKNNLDILQEYDINCKINKNYHKLNQAITRTCGGTEPNVGPTSFRWGEE